MYWNIKVGSTKESIGHAGLNIMLYLDGQKYKPDLLIVFYSKKEAHNELALKTMIKHLQMNYNVKLVNSYFFSRLFRIFSTRKIFRYLFKIFLADIYLAHVSDEYLSHGSPYRIWHKNSKQISCQLDYEFSKHFQKVKKDLGIYKKYVCVFTRDADFYPDDDEGKFRNTDFVVLDKTITYLLNNGYQVIRIGRNHKKDNYKNNKEGYIDLENSKVSIKPDVVDVLIIKNCEFILGSNSGLNMIAFLFNKPVLLHNYFPIGLKPIYEQGSYICQKYMKNGKIIPYSEIPKNLLLTESVSLLQSHNISLKQNTNSEILEFVKNQINGKFKSVVRPNLKELIYGGLSGFDSNWYKENSNLFN
jgi:putative glycosyltransferase (TIGR04372 family)